MIYYKLDQHGKITNVFETDDEEIARLNGYNVPSDKEIVKTYRGYKFKYEVTEDDFKPTQEEINEMEIKRIKAELASTDYKTLKYVDGALSESEYAEVRAYRAELRRQINELEAE